MTVYICTHKRFKPAIVSRYAKPLLVGAANNADKAELPYLKDDTGDNISGKNASYCELTGLYWIWKNSKDNVLGLCHYRRYFDVQDNEIYDLLDRYDIILPKMMTLPFSLKFDYCYHHIREDYQILEETTLNLFPEYANTFTTVLNSNKLSPYNMLIAKRDVFNGYCSWLFAILNEVEKRIKISDYPYQKRVFGFMAERLMQVYVTRNHLNVKRVNITETETSLSSKTTLRHLKNDIFFALTHNLVQNY